MFFFVVLTHLCVDQFEASLSHSPGQPPRAFELLTVGSFKFSPPVLGQNCVQLPYLSAGLDGPMPLPKNKSLNRENKERHGVQYGLVLKVSHFHDNEVASHTELVVVV